MKNKRRTANQDRATAYHEVGHAVMAFKLHIPVGRRGVTIVGNDDYAGRMYHSGAIGGNPEFQHTDRMVAMAERQVMVSLAGIEAQRKYRKTSVRSYHGTSDFRRAVDILVQFAMPKEVELWLKLLQHRTRSFVDSPVWWSVIEGLATVLIEKRHLSGPETVAAIRCILNSRSESDAMR